MLGKLLILSSLFISMNVFACWKVEGTFAADGQTWKINQKFEHKKDYAFPMGEFILKLKLLPNVLEGVQEVKYAVDHKKGTTLTPVTFGTEKMKINKVQTIFAKGLEGQPHSIITLKVTKI